MNDKAISMIAASIIILAALWWLRLFNGLMISKDDIHIIALAVNILTVIINLILSVIIWREP